MPTFVDETLRDRYAREHADHMARLARMTPEQIAELELSLHNALAERDALAADNQRQRQALERLTIAAMDADIGYLDAAISNAEAALAAKK